MCEMEMTVRFSRCYAFQSGKHGAFGLGVKV